MPRLIWVFAGRTSFCWFCHEVAHIVFGLIWLWIIFIWVMRKPVYKCHMEHQSCSLISNFVVRCQNVKSKTSRCWSQIWNTGFIITWLNYLYMYMLVFNSQGSLPKVSKAQFAQGIESCQSPLLFSLPVFNSFLAGEPLCRGHRRVSLAHSGFQQELEMF